MKPTIHGVVARSALTLGLVAGGWVILTAWAPGLGTLLPTDPPVAARPDRILVAQADAAPAETPVHYSSDQADRGEERYADNCVDCHGEDLTGGLLGGAPLKGLAFDAKYAKGAPAGLLFEVMSATMPPNAPGRFSPSQYADLMAYILKKNGYKAGAELPSDVDALYSLTMTK